MDILHISATDEHSSELQLLQYQTRFADEGTTCVCLVPIVGISQVVQTTPACTSDGMISFQAVTCTGLLLSPTPFSPSGIAVTNTSGTQLGTSRGCVVEGLC